jgi:glycosyltransferase involved in cell wall biosynthesis
MLKIVHITKNSIGGAGWAAQDICDSLPGSDENQPVIQKFISNSTPDKIMLHKESVRKEDLLMKRFAQIKDSVFISSNRTTEHISLGNPSHYLNINEKFDIVHLHEVSDFVRFPETFEKMNHNVPIVWTLHDMNPITGGCHYFHGCTKYESECLNCPQLGSLKSIDLINFFFKEKIKFFESKDVHLVAVSSYTYNLAKSSCLGKLAKSILLIPYGIKENKFSIIESTEKESLRKTMKLPSGKLILGLGAYGLHRDIKGINDFLKIIKKTKYRDSIFIVLFGNGDTSSLELDGLEYHYFGEIHSISLLNIVYSILDFFVFYSKEEAFGRTITESLQCGIPVLGRKTGCIADVIEHTVNGYIFRDSSIEEMNNAIKFCIDNKSKFNSFFIRDRLITEHSNVKTGKAHIKLYKKLLYC